MGPFELLSQTPTDGPHTVYLAEAGGQRYAVTVRPDSTTEGWSLDEHYSVTRRLSHPNIVRTAQYGKDGDTAFLATQWVEGRSLQEVLRAYQGLHRGMSLAAASTIVRNVALALEYLHGHGVVHRDVTPGNIVIGIDGRVVLTGFAAACRIGAKSAGELGDPRYMAPARFRGKIDARDDLFSLGAVWFECLDGELFRGRDLSYESLVRMALRGDIPELDLELPKGAAHMLGRLLSTEEPRLERGREIVHLLEASRWFSDATSELAQIASADTDGVVSRRTAESGGIATGSVEAVNDDVTGPHHVAPDGVVQRRSSDSGVAPQPVVAPRPSHEDPN